MVEGKPITDATFDAAREMFPHLNLEDQMKLFRILGGPLPPKRRYHIRRVIICDRCGDVVLRTGNSAKYCKRCSLKVQYQARAEFYRRHKR